MLLQWLPGAWRRGGRRRIGNRPGARGVPSARLLPGRPDGPGDRAQVGLPLARHMGRPEPVMAPWLMVAEVLKVPQIATVGTP